MKKIYHILLTVAALLAFAPAISAQGDTPQKPDDCSINGQILDPDESLSIDKRKLVFPKDFGLHEDKDNNFAYSKNISKPFSDGTYWIKLESFATGNAKIALEDAPADIVLVLDVSGSMNSSYTNSGTSYVPATSSRTANYNQAGNPEGAYDYNNIDNNASAANRRYALYNGEYYRVYRGRVNGNSGNYFIYFEVNGKRYYLDHYTITDVMPTSYTNQYQAWWGGILYQRDTDGITRLQALKIAVEAFIYEIQDNDLYAKDDDGVKTRRTDEQGNPTSLGNRVSIIKYAGNRYYNDNNHLAEGNHRYNNNNYNYSELVKNYTYVDDLGVASLLRAIGSLNQGGATAADYGMQIANEVLAQPLPTDRTTNVSKTVVLFTDGEPNHQSGFDNSVANTTINRANTAKTTNEATVFTVGIFSNETNNIRTYMNRASSNYTGATSMTNAGANQVDTKYYKNAANGDLTEVFTQIAQQSGGTQSALSSATSTVDVVSNSFMLPEDVDASNIASYVKVFTAKLRTIDSDGNYVWEEEILAPWSDDTYNIYSETGAVLDTKDVDNEITVSLKQGTRNSVKVTNFDYSNNWCGKIVDEVHGTTTYQGHKIIIMIPIKMNPDAVGGPNVDTNGQGSGIFLSPEDTDPAIFFESPTVSLPVNMYISKTGLRPGESAKFKIERAVIPDDPDDPDDDDWDLEDIADDAWSYVSSVFVTNSPNAQHTEDGDPVVRVKGMPATTMIDGAQWGYIYRITEEEWSWSYLRDETPQYTVTSKVDNPFEFGNTKKPNIDYLVRHAESKATNQIKVNAATVVYDDSKKNTGTGRPNN